MVVSTLDDIIDSVRDSAGADFSFILSRRGRLVTRHAPENMPEEGREALVKVAETVLGSDRVALRTWPREAIVPYGGAAPVDIYIGARDAAILCVVMATWTDQSAVMPAFEIGFGAVDRLIDEELQKRGKPEASRRKKTIAPAAPGSSPGKSRKVPSSAPSSSAGTRRKTEPPAAQATRRKTEPPSQRGERKTMLGVDDPALIEMKTRADTPIPKAPQSSSGKSRGRTQRPPPFSMSPKPRSRTERPPPNANGAPPPAKEASNEGFSKEAPLGRGTLPFIPGDNSPTQQVLRALARAPVVAGPEITLSEGRIGRATFAAIEMEIDAPEITFGAATIGRATMAEIDASAVPQGRGSGSAPDLRVSLASMPDIDMSEMHPIDRMTLPFTETAADTKRAYDDAAKKRGLEAPDVRVRLSNLDWDTKAAVLEEAKPDLEEAAKRARRQSEAVLSKRNSNIEAWHDALNEIVEGDGKPRKRPRAK